MKLLHEHFNNCRQIVRELGIPIANIIGIDRNDRAKSRWGLTSYIPSEDTYYIQISSLLLDDSVPDDYLDETIIHELLHTCEDCLNHGTKWKEYAKRVMKHYPQYRIKTSCSYTEKGIKEEEVIKYRYLVTCLNCGHEFKEERACNITRHPEYYMCSYCGGDLKVERIEQYGLEY